MNILFFIGNGFDINIGMNTRYSDFYNYYQKVKSQNHTVRKVKSNISSNIENWSDLELALGSYTTNLKGLNDFDEMFEDIGLELSKFLQAEEKKIDYSTLDSKKAQIYLTYPERYLLPADKIKVQNFKNKWSSSNWNINIVTFNYTKSLEKIIGYKKNIQFNTRTNITTLKSIEHIHGYTDDRMVMGVNDVSQIKNKAFHKKQEILEALIKSNCNQVQKHTIDDLCKSQISSANLICIFGSSIGESDKMWWELIGERLKNDCRLIIFERCQEVDPRIRYRLARFEREVRNKFLSKTNLTESEKSKINEKIDIGLNSDIFNLNKQ